MIWLLVLANIATFASLIVSTLIAIRLANETKEGKR